MVSYVYISLSLLRHPQNGELCIYIYKYIYSSSSVTEWSESRVMYTMYIYKYGSSTSFTEWSEVESRDLVTLQDEDDQELVADGVLSMRWSDFRLAWDPWVSHDIQSIVWPKTDHFWTPDILVLNGYLNK